MVEISLPVPITGCGSSSSRSVAATASARFATRQTHGQTVIVKAPCSFVEQVLWPEFQELRTALTAYLAEITERLIREEVYGETTDAEERDEPRRLGR
jgi:hypothetical protein